MAERKAVDVAETAFKMATDVFGLSKYRKNDTTDYGGDYRWNVGWWKDGYWHSDCLGFVHIVVNGFTGDKDKLGGGAVMDDFVLASDEYKTLHTYCSKRGGYPVKALKPATLLQNSGHVGLYIGEHEYNGKTYNTAECTLALEKGWLLTWVDLSTGARYSYKGGAKLATGWDAWGEFDRLDYTEQKEHGRFTDVTKDMSSYKAIEWMAEKGWVQGYKDGTYRPNEPLTRGQYAVIRWREAGRPEPKKTGE